MRRRWLVVMGGGGVSVPAIPWYLSGGILEADIAGAWTMKGQETLAASYLRLAGDMGNASIDPAIVGGTAPAFSKARGQIFTATSSQYLKTGIVIPAGNTYTVVCAFANWRETGGTEHCYGTYLAGAGTRCIPITSGNMLLANRTITSGAKNYSVVVHSGIDLYVDGADTALNATANSANGLEMYIGGLNNNNVAGGYGNGDIIAFGVFKRILTAAEILAVTNAINAIPTYVSAYGQIHKSISGLLSYLPLDDPAGTVAADGSGNNRFGINTSISLNQAGDEGASYLFAGTNTSSISASAGLRAAINPREYSVSFMVKANSRVDLQVRLSNLYFSSLAGYSALELRTGVNLGIYLREGGADQVISEGVLGTTTDDTWHRIVLFNSESEGKIGIYFNGELREVERTLAGSADIPDTGWPVIGAYLDGYMQHVAWYDHKLTQAEANSLL